MHKIDPNSLTINALFNVSLDELVPKDHPKRIILDKVPWSELVKIGEKAYKSDYWRDKPNARIMIGLFVWACITDDQTYRNIEDDFRFNSLCAYACGFKNIAKRNIHHTTLLKFEENLGKENVLKIKDIIEMISVDKQPPNSKGRNNSDTTVFESNITFPTDVKLMETVRLFLVEDIINKYQKEVNQNHRTYNRIARSDFLGFSKKRITSQKQIHKIKKTQLQYLKRNVSQAEEALAALKEKIDKEEFILKGKNSKKIFKKLKTKLSIAKQIYSQQFALFKGEKIKDRIVSFHRPNIRPIFRGKAKKKTEFGVKVQTSLMGKALIIGKISYDNFHDGHGTKEAIEEMQKKKYPLKEQVGDKGLSGITNFLKENNIIDGIEKGGKRKKDPPIPKKRFARERNRQEGCYGLIKTVFIKGGLRAKTDFGDLKKICKAAIGFNLRYAF
jgi:transposase, IS5 family